MYKGQCTKVYFERVCVGRGGVRGRYTGSLMSLNIDTWRKALNHVMVPIGWTVGEVSCR